MAETKKAFGRLKWLASLGGLVFVIGLLLSFSNGVPGAILATLGIIIMLLVGYMAYSYGKAGA